MNELIQTVSNRHRHRFGQLTEITAFAPGRIEVLGNHTDYNAGTVLSAAINLGHSFCISRSAQPGVRLYAADVDRTAVFDTSNDQKVSGAGWADYVKGVFFLLEKKTGEKIDGIDCTFLGNIPIGAGLSSSAALEVAAATALLGLLGKELDKKEIGKLCREAEHRFAGTNCGLLDQFSSLFGCEHSLIHSDFQTLEISPVLLPEDVEFLVVNPHVKHSLAASPYNERRERCEQAAAQLGALLPHPVKTLRDVSLSEFAALKKQIDPSAAKRAAHIVGEIDRVEKGVALLKKNALAAFGALLFESHRSSIEHFENSCSELDVIVEAARAARARGARLSGGGFGGSAIVLVHANRTQAVSEKIRAACRIKGFDPDFLAVVPSAGARIVS